MGEVRERFAECDLVGEGMGREFSRLNIRFQTPGGCTTGSGLRHCEQAIETS